MSKNLMSHPYIQMGMSMLHDMESQKNEWKDRIIKEWAETKNLPRKKKKARRKELLRDWSIACYDPFGVSDLLDKL